jgi:arabinose-5-phosphate isomerase
MNAPTSERQGIRDLALAVLQTEAEGILALRDRIDDDFARACRLMLQCRGRIVVLGMGKSGHIAGKIAATLASTGSPAFFVHPGEASHGDLGMIVAHDVVLALSNSGETEELLTILPLLRRKSVPLVALTGNPMSRLAQEADVHLNVAVAQEACPLGLAPTASTTAALAMGDALAIALLQSRGFTAEDFAQSHPGGSLGRRLLLHVRDIMHQGQEVPMVAADASLNETLLEMTRCHLGMTAITDPQQRPVGIFTDGDLRRTIEKGLDFQNRPIQQLMTRNCKTMHAEALAVEAVQLMERHKINALLVVDRQQRLIGALNMHDLLRAGVV